MSINIKVTMSLAKSTKRTHVYKNDEKNVAISSVYIKKEALNSTPPKIITIMVEE